MPVKWYRNGQEIVPGDNVIVKSIGKVHRLTLFEL